LAAPTFAIEFDEAAYLATFPDVSFALDTGEFETARQHFEVHGVREDRLWHEAYIRALGLAARPAVNQSVDVSIDTIMASPGGTVLIVGWMDDRESPLASISLFGVGSAYPAGAWHSTALGRVRRPDVEAVKQAPPGHLFGFWAVLDLRVALTQGGEFMLRVRRADGKFGEVRYAAALVSDAALRTTILGHFATASYFGSRDVESFAGLEAGIGDALVALNRRITAGIVAGAWVTYYGPARQSYRGSVIVCLYGKPEFLFLQAAFFSMGYQAAEYEFVYVSNSPELTETLVKEAKNCARIYGISIVLVCLPENAGFGAANNVAARYARSNRLMITNPDVFPRDDGWAQRHAIILESQPGEQTMMFGAPLFYDDGSLMHHGMYFEVDTGFSIRPDGIFERPMIRTEHYGKGAPAWSKNFVAPRPVSAVSGAFISAQRDWFESLGGFNEDFLFGHYEDCDLCLKSFARGVPAWVQEFPLWHMEGKGSTRRESHEGGMLVNRWLFTRQWGALISDTLRGPNPAALAFEAPPLAPMGKMNAARKVRR
jgi:GT2 family glycosyltransferase